MKKYITLLILFLSLSSTAFSQAVHVFHNHQEKADVYLNAEIDSIKFLVSESSPEGREYAFFAKKGIKKIRYRSS